MVSPGKIVILYTDAGGGHRATAQALQEILKRETAHEVTLLNPYKELIADIDLFPRFTGYSDEDVYNHFVLDKGWTNNFCMLYYGLTLLNVRLGTKVSVARFLERWRQESPDLVISVMPLANQGFYQSVRAYTGASPVPFLVVITDLDEKIREVWFPREQDYYIVCGSERTYRQALAKPHPPQRVFQTSGQLVHPEFYRPPPADPAAERRKQGLRPHRVTGCIMYGSAGSRRMVQLAQAVRGVDRKFQMIFLCGHNQTLADDLKALELPYPHLILTYTTEVQYYFRLSDFLVSKPGPGTVSEALVTGLTLLVDNKFVLPQERYNVKWIKQNRLGLSFRNMDDFRRAVEVLTAGEAAGHRRPPGVGQENRAIFEIPAIIDGILQRPAAPATS